MYEHFTDRSRMVISLANEEAKRMNHEYIGTEHILLGLVKESEGVAAVTLKSFGVYLESVRYEIEKLVQGGPDPINMSKLPMTPRAKQIIVHASNEARRLNHEYVDTEHLLLGVVCDSDGVAAQILMNLGVVLIEVRAKLLIRLKQPDQSSEAGDRTAAYAHELWADIDALMAADIGNSRMKIGRFSPRRVAAEQDPANELPIPVATLDLAIDHATGYFDETRIFEWCMKYFIYRAGWYVASVHRAAADRLIAAATRWAVGECPIRRLTYRDVPLAIHVDEPARVGIDRLLAALAADRIRQRDRAAIVVDLGSAITVDMLDASGAFCGGAILPGIAMSARALEEHTDALPWVALDHLKHPPEPIGKSTIPAIEAGLYWGAVGAVRELISQMSKDLSAPPDVFLTGGASSHVAKLLETSSAYSVRHLPHLVLSGIALVNKTSPDETANVR